MNKKIWILCVLFAIAGAGAGMAYAAGRTIDLALYGLVLAGLVAREVVRS